MQATQKPKLSLLSIIQMNLGFLGLQFSFGLQQANMTPIYAYLGADYGNMPILWLAGPMTGLIVQPIIGALSDRTVTRWGRRTPYFLIGAIFCSLALLFMPYSAELWIAASLLWILDAANNVTMEPYRAYVKDRLNEDQHRVGFLTQSAFTGLAQTLAYAMPSIFVGLGSYFLGHGIDLGLQATDVRANGIPNTVYIAFIIGAILSISTIVWSVLSVRELPLTEAEITQMKSRPMGVITMLGDIKDAIIEMPYAMRQMAWMKLFQWYAMFCYWQYVALSYAKSAYGITDAKSPAFKVANLEYGEAGAFYNFIAFASALLMVPVVRKYGAKYVHAFCLLAGGAAMLLIPGAANQTGLWIPMIGIGLAWGSIMGNPYIMLAGSIPPERTGIYMGIFNMFIVIPMMIQIFTFWAFGLYDILGNDPGHVLYFAGVLMFCGAIATLFVNAGHRPSVSSKA